MRRAILAAATVLAPLVLAAPPAMAAQRVLVTSFGPSGPAEIAMDGSRVAVVDTETPCRTRVRLANVVTGAVRLVGRATECDDELNPEGGSPVLALAGSNVLLAMAWESNSHHPRLYAGGPARPLRLALEGDEADHDLGDFLGAVVGSGSRRLYATWGYSWLPEGCDPLDEEMTCTLSPPEGAVRRFPGGDAVATLTGATIPLQMEGELVALRGSAGAVRVLGTDGAVHADLPAARARSAAVVGDRLVTLRRGSSTLDVWDSATGAVVRAIPLARGATGRIDAARVNGDAWAVYRTPRAVHAVRLRDGRDVLVARPTRARVTDVQIESPGVTWTTTRGPAGRPTAATLRFATLPRTG